MKNVIPGIALALALGAPFAALAAGNVKAGPVAAALGDSAPAELERLSDMYRTVTSYHLVLAKEAGRDLVTSALFDVERYVREMHARLETSELFVRDEQALGRMKMLVAKAHLQCALLHARGVDLERSIVHYEQALDLVGQDPAAWDTEVEISAQNGRLPGGAEAIFRLATPGEAVQQLKTFWSSGVVTRFKLVELTPAQRETLRLERFGGAMDGFSTTAFDLASGRFSERAGEGLEEYRVVLPAGRYRVISADKTLRPVEFHVTQGNVPDAVTVSPNTFHFEWAAADATCRPQLSLNGLPVREISHLPFGSYRVTAPKGCARRLPDKITVEQGSTVSLRSEPPKIDQARPGEPIFLFVTTPPGSVYHLRM